MGKPIITTEASGCRQLVTAGFNGLLVPSRDPERLAEAMRWCISHRQRLEAMGATARRFVEQEYSEATVLERSIASYDLPVR